MTCIVGIAHEGKVILGADSQAGDYAFNRRVRADRKIFRNGELVFGFTTSFRMGQLLQFGLTPPPINEGQPAYEYAVKSLIPAIRETFRSGGFMRLKDNREEGGQFLVGFRGHLFMVDVDFQVGESVDSFEAVGCGDCYAMGAMHASADRPPLERLEAGLRAAAKFSSGVAEPFHFLTIPEASNG